MWCVMVMATSLWMVLLVSVLPSPVSLITFPNSLALAITIDDDLPPLERARRRKSMLVGPRP